MTRKALSELHDWKLEHREQDIRGWPLQDDRGARLGTIDDLIVDTNSEYVDAVRLKDGTEYSANRIEIGNRVVTLRGTAGTTAATSAGRESIREGHGHDTHGDTTLPIIEEDIDIGKRRIEQGGIRVTTHVKERPVEEDVRLREERVHVDRHAADRPATEADFERMRNKEFELRESEEEPVVRKSARVTEEVHIDKQAREHTEKVRGTERRTDVDVEKLNERDRKR